MFQQNGHLFYFCPQSHQSSLFRACETVKLNSFKMLQSSKAFDWGFTSAETSEFGTANPSQIHGITWITTRNAQVKGHDSLGTANVAANWARQLQRHNRHAEARSKWNLWHKTFQGPIRSNQIR